MQTGTPMDAREVPVKLKEHEVAERGESLAAKVIHIESLRKKLADHNKSQKAIIDAELGEAARLARVIADGVEQRKQADLKFGDEVIPSTTEAAAALAEVATRAPEFHKNGELCKREICKRKHHAAEALRANGIAVEGDPLVPEGESPTSNALQVGSPCPGCEKPIQSATEAAKALCEDCQLAPGGDPLAGTPQEAPQWSPEDPTGAMEPPLNNDGSVPDDDPRPRCSAGGEVLTADEVEKGLGLCRACIDQAGGEDAPTESEEAPAVGGEAGA